MSTVKGYIRYYLKDLQDLKLLIKDVTVSNLGDTRQDVGIRVENVNGQDTI